MHFIQPLKRLVPLLPALFATAMHGADVEVVYDDILQVPVTADDYQANGKSIALKLNTHPPTGTDLKVIDNTGTGFINGTFTNLAQGEPVQLEHDGIFYSFVANYYAGTGNDLVLQWANRRLVGWGDNQKGQLGNTGSGKTGPGVWVNTSGVLAGKIVTEVAVGASHAMALCSDGTLASWGYNYYGQLGDGTTYDSSSPVLVNRTGVLAGKTIVKIACGEYHSLALCSDGTLAAWGTNQSAQLGDGTTISRTSPAAVDRTGILAGKTVVAIAAAQFHNLVLCSDGSMATWGGNTNGKLGNGGTASSMVPVSVVRTGVLAGKTVTSIAVGSQHSLVLCSDGTLASWGANSYGQLGSGNVTSSNVPVLVRTNGVLAGRLPVAIAGGNVHSLALCADGFLAGWGGNGAKQLGTSASITPIAMPSGGALAGRTLSRIEGGKAHTVTICKDSAIVAWGYNQYGELAHDTGQFVTTSSTPVLADRITLPAGARFVDVKSGSLSFSNITTVALPVPPAAQTLAASDVTDTSAKLNGKLNPAGTNCTVRFEYGLTTGYGLSIAATPETLSGMVTVSTSAALANLRPDTIYHYRITATFAGETIYGMDSTFKTTDAATLASLGTSYGGVHPPVGTHETNYHLIVPHGITEIQATPVATHADSTIRLDGRVISPAAPDTTLALAEGLNEFEIRISSVDGINQLTYTLSITRLPESLMVDSSGVPPVLIGGGTIPAVPARVILNHKPLPGEHLTLIRHDGTDLLQGAFDNMKQGDVVKLDHAGNTYYFIADYAGGDGNDLVLRWKNSRLMAWGYNNLGQLGNGNTNDRNTPTPVIMTGALAGKTISRLSAGEYHSLALCTDGTIAAWGSNSQGELGANSTAYSSPVPILVDRSGVLAGKQVVDVCAGGYVSAALCSDGTVATWGGGSNGALGNNDAQDSRVPVAVDTSGVLNGQRIVALSAGFAHMLALCSDGTLVTWGNDQYGQLGTGIPVVPLQFDRSLVPYQVVRGITSGKTVSSISAGGYHNLVRFSDGSLASWGANTDGQLGNNSNTTSSIPVWVDQTGILTGKTPKTLLAASYSSLAFCSDGTIATWGMINTSLVPVGFPYAGALAGKSLRAVIGKGGNFHAITTDGSMAGWGANYYGQIGNGNNVTSNTPSQVSTAALRQGEIFVGGSSAAFHTLALVASPLQSPATLAATAISGTSATLRGSVAPNNNAVSLHFEYGTDTSYGSTMPASPATASGMATVTPIAIPSTLIPGTTYHYRLVASGEHGIMRGADMTFTTLSDNARLAGLGLETGTLSPQFDRNHTSYITTVSHDTETIKLTPLVEHAGAKVAINGMPATNAIPLAVGPNAIQVVVTAEDGVSRMTYIVEITRVPGVFRFDSPQDVPLTVARLAPGSVGIRFQLGFAPTPGTSLTAVNVTDPGFIVGIFANLPHGARVTLDHDGIDYSFIVNYHGGTGNDLVLQWAGTTVLTWGYNRYGQLGNGTTANQSLPEEITQLSEFPRNTTCTATGSGYLHTLALLADGRIFSWGYNIYGQLGTGTSTQSAVPAQVDQSGALSGKTVVAIACGAYHNLALCSDGSIASWGYNNYGQLGTGDTKNRNTPDMVARIGALAGRTVVGIAAGAYHSVALCSDGTVVAWGFNDDGELGNGGSDSTVAPVAVDRSGVLAAKTVISITAGQYHTLALCSDGTIAAWGYNLSGQCGVATPARCAKPVVPDSAGSLTGRRVSRIAAGAMHSLALTDDGAVHTWGSNSHGQIAQPGQTKRAIPSSVAMPPAKHGGLANGITAGAHHSLVVLSDGEFVSFGANSYGQLGNGTTTPASTAALGAPLEMPAIQGSNGSSAMHSVVMAALPAQSVGMRTATASSGTSIPDPNRDDDNDGLANILEYAFGLDQNAASVGGLPEWKTVDGFAVARFTRPAAVSGIDYGAEWSPDLIHWLPIPDSGSGDEHVFKVQNPAAGRLFLRLKVVER